MTASSIARGTESFPRVFVDTSAFYALEDASDRYHREARLIQRWCLAQRPRLFTTDHVIDESITLIAAHLRPARAVRFARLLLASRIVLVVRTHETLDEAALNVYERLDDARVSFTDCVSRLVSGGHVATVPSTVHWHPEILRGRRVFRGTRVAVKNLFDYIAGGDTLDQFLDDFPSVSREMAIAALKVARDLLTAGARAPR